MVSNFQLRRTPLPRLGSAKLSAGWAIPTNSLFFYLVFTLSNLVWWGLAPSDVLHYWFQARNVVGLRRAALSLLRAGPSVCSGF